MRSRYAFFAAGVLVLGALVRTRYAVITVRGQSMLPTLADGDRVLVRRIGLSKVQAGDVVILEKPDDGKAWRRPPAGARVGGRFWLIKRAVAVPGDLLPGEVRDQLPDDLVPPGRFVVLGDNRDGSFDSRSIGYIPADRLLGVMTRRMVSQRSLGYCA
jgi:signal peptidase I